MHAETIASADEEYDELETNELAVYRRHGPMTSLF